MGFNPLWWALANGGSGGGGGSASVAEKDVNYYDYDGTVLYSYTAAEALALTEEPPLPERAGLICQGWNVSLEDMQSYVRKYGMRDVGATYITDDDKTRIYIHLEEGRTSPMLGVGVNGTVTVDWGDGTEPDVLTGTRTSTVKRTPKHAYGEAGDYIITLTVDGEFAFFNSGGKVYLLNTDENSGQFTAYTYMNAIYKVEIGTGMTGIGESAFDKCYFLRSITIPNGVINIGQKAFIYCSCLTRIVIPAGATTIGQYSFGICNSLQSVILPDSVQNIDGYSFRGSVSLSSLIIPDGVTNVGSYFCEGCSNLRKVVIPNTAVMVYGTAFSDCGSLTEIVIPNGVKTIGGSAFSSCTSLKSVILPETLTSIGSSAFSNCVSLRTVTIPSGVMSIEASTFSNCHSACYYDFSQHTAVPTLSATSAFSNIPADCEIRVPAALVDEWKAATNWSTYADKIVGV